MASFPKKSSPHPLPHPSSVTTRRYAIDMVQLACRALKMINLLLQKKAMLTVRQREIRTRVPRRWSSFESRWRLTWLSRPAQQTPRPLAGPLPSLCRPSPRRS